MRLALEGSQAMARAVAMCRPQVVAAYPITPQTHIVENIAKLVADGKLDAELVSVESEHSAASVALGAACAGARAYTASSSQGIMLMSEVLFDIAGLRVPVVMTCANRAVSGPLSIWNDHQDAMAMRDSGWIQLYCADNQEAVDTSIQAFRLAEILEVPVMVCVDGFALTHTLEAIDVPAQDQVDAFLPAYQFSRSLDSARPISIGPLVSPDFFTEARASHHNAILAALEEIPRVDAAWQAISGRSCGGLLEVRGDPAAKIGILTLGSVLGTLEDAMDAHPELPRARFIKLRAFRPFPVEALRAACQGLTHLVIFERAFSPGMGGIVASEVKSALFGHGAPHIVSYAAGLGGRDVGLDAYPKLLQALEEDAEHFRFFDLKPGVMPEGGY